MPLPTDLASIVKILVDLVRALRDESSTPTKHVTPVTAGGLMEIYGLLTKLEELVPKAAQVLERADEQKRERHDQQVVQRCFDTIYEVVLRVRDLDLDILNLYYPGIGEAIRGTMHREDSMIRQFTNRIAPAYGLDIPSLPKSLQVFLHSFSTDHWLWEGDYYYYRDIGKVSPQDLLQNVGASCKELRAIVGTMLREQWTLKDLAQS